ncbi:MFS transporter [Vagococcus vulneris]|uniref:MFS transporter n=1 Tax=Vagococcus vulneris TaxID=1977869 RepID=A0A429ZP73_9ENTE|nr:MFS transporter [Vagococcus vulneris]RST95510.1 MFS transporter [Vagococcus vulneris]
MKEKRIFYGWWIVAGSVLITSTLVPSVVALANKFLLPVTADMGISRSAFTLSNTILQAMGIFLSPFVAKKISQGNLKRIQSTAIFIFAGAYASYGFATRPIYLYLLSVIIGICYLFATIIPVSIMITNWFVKKRGLAMSIAMTGIGLGGFIFSPLITIWINHYGWRTTYMIMGAVLLIVSLPISLFVFKKNPAEKGLLPYGSNEQNGYKEEHDETATVKLTMKEAIKKPFFILLIVGMTLNGVINSGALGQFPPALEGLQTPTIAATIISLYSLIGIAGKLSLGWINDRFGIIASSIYGCVAFGLAFFFILSGDNYVSVYLVAITFGLGIGIGTVSPPLVTSSIFSKEQYGEAYGYTSSAMQAGMSIGSLFVAIIYDNTGSYQTAWIILIVLTILTLTCWISSFLQSRKYC